MSCDEVLDLDPDRAARHALGRGALEAAQRLGRRAQDGQALVDLLEVRAAAARPPAPACAAGGSSSAPCSTAAGVGGVVLMSSGPRGTDLGMLLLQPARLADPLELVLGMLEESLERLGLVLEVRPVALGEDVEIDRRGRRTRARRRRRTGAPCVVSTRQPPHIPVPSTIIELRLTTVWIAVRPGRLGDGLHHPRRPDGQHEVDLPARLDQLLELVGHEALHAVAAVVGRDRRARR